MTEKTDIRDSDEKVVEIEMERLRNFTNHPFKIIGDSQMIELQDSIKKYGVLNPLIVRPRKEGYYEIISGHRRKYAAERLGYKKIPVIIRMMQDDEAVVTMVNSNLQREQITPSEKAYAYKMKYDAIKKKAGRKNCGQVDHNSGKRSIDVIGELCGDSAKQVQRYIKMTELMVYDTYSASIKVFGTEIPMSVRASEVSVEGGSIYSYDPKGKAAFAYMALTKEVLKEAE